VTAPLPAEFYERVAAFWGIDVDDVRCSVVIDRGMVRFGELTITSDDATEVLRQLGMIGA
jgi:hypothetical protein